MGVRDRIDPFTRAEGTRDAKRFGRMLPGWLRRWLLPIALMASAVVVLASTQSGGDADVENLWAPLAFVLFIGGATAWVWRKARGEGFEALRWRRLHRRVFWRAAAASLLASMVALWFVAYWQWRADNAVTVSGLPVWAADDAHAGFFRALSGWLAFAAIPLVVTEPFTWRLWPRPMRTAVRRARVAKLLSERTRFTRLDLDSNLGAVGRPEAFDVVRSREPSREVHRITPHGGRPADWVRAAADVWWRNAAITWDGSGLVLADAQGRLYAFPSPSRSAAAYRDAGAAAPRDGAVAEIVWFTEKRYYRATRSTLGDRFVTQVLLLDAQGRRLAEMPAAGFTAGDVAGLARASGLPFAAYHLGTVRQDERMANRLLFPRTRRTVKIAVPRAG